MRELNVDVGQTGARIRGLSDDGDLSTSFSSRRLASPGAAIAIATHLEDQWHRAGRPDVGHVALGLTGFSLDPAREVVERLCAATGARGGIASSDVVTAYLGAVGTAPGIVVIAGTGLVTTWLDGDGRHGSLGGTGWLLGDDGGGYWIGREGLLAARHAWEGRRDAPALLAAATDELGPMATLLERLYAAEAPVAEVAGFARAVSRLAAGGDAPSLAILDAAGDELASTVRVAARQFPAADPVAVSVVGGLTHVGDLLLGPLRTEIATNPRLRWVDPAGTPLDGVELLGRAAQRGLFADLLVSASSTSSQAFRTV